MPSEAEQYGKAGTPKRRIGFFQVLSCLSIKPIKTRWYSGLTKTSTACLALAQRERFSKVLKPEMNRFRTICTGCGYGACPDFC
ncbi:hypothetical protein [Neisseria meningitidis]|uniref:hypothetical protein n=1 Tax=Neisseria meningitidis TaxID=487 RepID=UPI0009A48FE6|nr:hypothetical protein [Neisseria meningitidis]